MEDTMTTASNVALADNNAGQTRQQAIAGLAGTAGFVVGTYYYRQHRIKTKKKDGWFVPILFGAFITGGLSYSVTAYALEAITGEKTIPTR